MAANAQFTSVALHKRECEEIWYKRVKECGQIVTEIEQLTRGLAVVIPSTSVAPSVQTKAADPATDNKHIMNEVVVAKQGMPACTGDAIGTATGSALLGEQSNKLHNEREKTCTVSANTEEVKESRDGDTEIHGTNPSHVKDAAGVVNPAKKRKCNHHKLPSGMDMENIIPCNAPPRNSRHL